MPSSGDSDTESDLLNDRKTTPELERGWISASQHKGKSVYSGVANDEDEAQNDEKAYACASTSQLLTAAENDTSAQDDEGQRLLAGQDADKEEVDLNATGNSNGKQQGKGRFKLGAADGALKHQRRQSKGQLEEGDRVLYSNPYAVDYVLRHCLRSALPWPTTENSTSSVDPSTYPWSRAVQVHTDFSVGLR